MANKNKKKIDSLKKYYVMACHNLFCCSANFGMSIPKEGFEKEWQEYSEECEMLDEMIKECEGEGVSL